MDQFAEVLFALNKHCFALLAVWLKEALQTPGFPSSRVTSEQKDRFCQQILRYHSVQYMSLMNHLQCYV